MNIAWYMCVALSVFGIGVQSTPYAAVAPTIAVTGIDVRDNHFRLDYKIENESKSEIWICDAMDSIQWGAPDFEAVPSEDGRTFIIRKRTRLRWEVMRDQIRARYVRLKAGKSLSGSLVMPLPAQRQAVVSGRGALSGSDPIQRLMLEIGYHKGDLPAMLLAAPHMTETRAFQRDQ